jgi:alanyl-tRNA synthetase
MTQFLFNNDPYLKECTATVERVEGNTVVLDKTVFFAVSGGQASDAGTIGGVAVTEARKDGEEIVYILADGGSVKVGDTVEVRIDWERRYALMKLHSALHLLYFLSQKMFGFADTIGTSIDREKARLDFECPEAVTNKLPLLEQEANEILAKQLPITRTWDGKTGHWQCGEWIVPCGGTHPKNTSEIGAIKLKRKNIGKGKERIEIYPA